MLVDERFAFARSAIDEARSANEKLWHNIGLTMVNRRDETMRIDVADRFDNPLSPALDRVARCIDECRSMVDDQNINQELRSQVNAP